jgi:hypothetical protein
MATSKYIRGLSGAGFRVPTNGSATALQRVTEKGNFQIDLDDDKTQKIIFGEKDNFIRVANSGATTATIIGLTRYGFRIRNSGGVWHTVKLGSGVLTVDLAVGETRRILRRNYGRYAFSASATQLAIRGIVAQQNGFDIKVSTSDSTSTIHLDSGANNAANTETVIVGAKTYTFKTALTEHKATNTLVAAGSGDVTAGDTVNVNGQIYTFRASVGSTANEVLVAGTADGSLDNLIAAINKAAGGGTTYGSATVANAFVTAGARSTHTSTLTSKVIGTVGNAYTLVATITASKITAGAGTFSGGLNAIANEVVVGVDGDTSLTNLSHAIDGGSGAGTTYATGTTANADATASAVSNHGIVITPVPGSEAIAISTTAAHLVVTNAELEDSIEKVYSGKTATVNPQEPGVYTQLRRHYKSWVEA